MKSGIYCITNKINGKVYIGSSSNLTVRITQHKSKLSKNRHENEYLQNSWLKNGADCFSFSIIEYCSKNILAQRERFWISEKKSFIRSYGYNIDEVPDRTGGVEPSICQIEKCTNKYLALGMCNKHYRRFTKYGDVNFVKNVISGRDKCSVDGCNRKHDSHGYCQNHAYFFRKYGEIRKPSIVFNPNRGCSFSGCDRKHQAKGLCKKHYTSYEYRKKHNLDLSIFNMKLI